MKDHKGEDEKDKTQHAALKTYEQESGRSSDESGQVQPDPISPLFKVIGNFFSSCLLVTLLNIKSKNRLSLRLILALRY